MREIRLHFFLVAGDTTDQWCFQCLDVVLHSLRRTTVFQERAFDFQTLQARCDFALRAAVINGRSCSKGYCQIKKCKTHSRCFTSLHCHDISWGSLSGVRAWLAPVQPAYGSRANERLPLYSTRVCKLGELRHGKQASHLSRH